MSYLTKSATAATYVLGDGPDVMSVRLYENNFGRNTWTWRLNRDGALLATGNDLTTTAWDDRHPAEEAMRALASFLGHDAEVHGMRPGGEPPVDGWCFDERVAEWAYGHADELAMIDEGLEV